jgi:predicted DNA-binding transcriptional regulator YafY
MRDIDRLYRYKSLLLSRHAVSSEELTAALGISVPTLKRDMAKLRERLQVPVVYDRALGGYRLEPGHGKRELPGLWLSPQDMVALATLQHLLADFAPGLLADKLAPLRERLASLLQDIDPATLDIAQRIRVVHAGQRRVPPAAFESAAWATLSRKRLKLVHHNRATNERLERTVSPQQLVHYRDNWYLDAWCHLRNGLRCFAVDALEKCTVLEEEAAQDMDPQTLREATQHSYGIFGGAPSAVAVLRFSPERARWVSGEIWHPEQQSEWLPSGHYLLKLPYSDDRELLGDLLRHGAECEVLGPPELRQKVAEAHRRAAQLYLVPPD